MNLIKKKYSPPPLWLVNLIQRIRGFLLIIEKRLVPAKFALLDMTFQFMVSKAIWAAAELNIAEYLRRGPRPVEELARLSGTHAESLFRVLRLLAQYGIFKQVRPRLFGLTRLARALYDEEGSIRPMIRFICGTNNWESFAQILDSMRTGTSSQKKNSRETFDDLANNPQLHDLFNNAMTAISELASDAILAVYDFSPYTTIVDVGGGKGTLLAEILGRHAHQRGILFDLPRVIKQSGQGMQSSRASSRIQAVEGDFFSSVPSGGEIYILKNVLHDWDDEHCSRILTNINQAMSAPSTLLIIEVLITNTNKASIGTLFDCQLLVSVDGGKERTREEFSALLSTARFHIVRIVPTFSGLSIIECRKL